MKRVLVALVAVLFGVSLLASPAGAEGRPTAAIVGGETASIQDVPWQVAVSTVMSDGQSFLCGGSIVAAEIIVTAAHCVTENGVAVSPQAIHVRSGHASLEATAHDQAHVSQVRVHPEYDASLFRNDVAVLHLGRALVLDGITRAAIRLPGLQNPQTWPAAGTPARISGWGSLRFDPQEPTDTLRKATVQVLTSPTDPRCGLYGRAYDARGMLCAGTAGSTIDACSGDSGGPLAVQENGVWILAGITSWGNECALPDYPGLYTRVTTYVDWIQAYLGPPAARASATDVDFGSVALGQAEETTVTVANSGHVALRFGAPVVSGSPQFSMVRTSCGALDGGGSCETVVRFAPTAGGAANATLQISSNADPINVTLRGSGVVVRPAAPLSPKVKASTKRLVATWSSVTGAQRYRVTVSYRNARGKKVVSRTSVTKPKYARSVRAKARSTVRVCVASVNTAGRSAPICTRKRVR